MTNYNAGHKNQKGIALVTALLLTLIGLAIILAAVYFVTQGTKMSGFQKKYATALEASHGGVEIITKEIIPKTIGGTALSSLGTFSSMLSENTTDACFTAKLTTATNSWGASCSSTLDPTNNPDITLTLNGVGSQPNLTVYAKIVDTVPGNSDTSGISLLGAGVVQSQSGIIAPQHFPYIYRVEVQGQRQTNPDEKANLSATYAY
ncbi:MAG: hypothetical protein ABSB95_10255 [Dissulfurispiraceae bacterium]|jgi:Tfp pilus assembly protein PilX